MHEASATESTRLAFETAHQERAEAFAVIVQSLGAPIRAMTAFLWPQDSTRRWKTSPQGCPAGH